MKLFVWTGVLRDYTSGVMVAMAFDVEQARELLKKECDYIPPEDLAQEPKVFELPTAVLCWGGG